MNIPNSQIRSLSGCYDEIVPWIKVKIGDIISLLKCPSSFKGIDDPHFYMHIYIEVSESETDTNSDSPNLWSDADVDTDLHASMNNPNNPISPIRPAF